MDFREILQVVKITRPLCEQLPVIALGRHQKDVGTKSRQHTIIELTHQHLTVSVSVSVNSS